MTALLFLGAACVAVLLALPAAEARAGGLGANPIMGWNTWCTQNTCGVDWCTSAEVLDVAQAIKDQGMLDVGYNYINLDDCWGVRDPKTDEIMGDPTRFPEGMKAFIAKIHALGFKFGLYTDIGESACHSPFTGSAGHQAADARTFADWEVDYVKFDSCHLPAGFTPEQLTCNMSDSMVASGRDMWLNFHCWHTDSCGKCGNSFRIASDHHDTWLSSYGTSSVMLALIERKSWWGPNPEYGWPDLDFVFTGGQGCGDHSPPGVRCPGQTNDEYISEFTIWAIASGQILIAVDPRNMTDFQRSVWFNKEVINMYNDTTGFRQVKMLTGSKTIASPRPVQNSCNVTLETQISASDCKLDTSFGCFDSNTTMWTDSGCRGIFTCDGVQSVVCDVDGDGRHYCDCTPGPLSHGQIWTRPRSTGAVAAAFHNPNGVAVDITLNFSFVPAREWAGKTLNVRDMWAQKDIGQATGTLTIKNVPAHGTRLVNLSATSA